MVVPPAQFLYFRYGDQRKTAAKQRVISLFCRLFVPPAAEDFRGERDVVR